MRFDRSCDVLVIGSGAGGLSAAVTAAWHGLDVVVAEKEKVCGGASAWSGGWMWIPRNPLAMRAGIVEAEDAPLTYLKYELGNYFDAPRVEAFLKHGPAMVSFFETETELTFADGNGIADIHGNSPGAGTGGRSIIAAPFDGRELGDAIALLRKPLRETSLFGMPIQAGPDLAAFLSATKSLKSAKHVATRLARHARDLLLHGRAMQLVNGSALVGRLLASARKTGVTIQTELRAKRLIVNEGRVSAVLFETAQGETTIEARRGVILATGGFPHDRDRRKQLFPHAPTGTEHWSVAAPGATGDGLRLAESVGAVVETNIAAAGAWCPVSLVPHADGSVGHFPHIIDRAKPGLIGVLKNGKRFCNEADGYYDYVAAMLTATPHGETPQSWMICDHRFQRRYGLGYSRPAPMPIRHLIDSGYLIRANTIAELAQRCGIDVSGLTMTVAAFNQDARDGKDTAFGRGSTLYNRKNGDPSHGPNPCVAPIVDGPFYAVRVVPGSFGTFAGLKTDPQARVLDATAKVIPGLYAVGTDMASVMGGYYPAGGINLGPAMTFGYIAGNTLAAERNVA
jgi:succinate dehydrogenase/fumarate reductase flavoprotein subunit